MSTWDDELKLTIQRVDREGIAWWVDNLDDEGESEYWETAQGWNDEWLEERTLPGARYVLNHYDELLRMIRDDLIGEGTLLEIAIQMYREAAMLQLPKKPNLPWGHIELRVFSKGHPLQGMPFYGSKADAAKFMTRLVGTEAELAKLADSLEPDGIFGRKAAYTIRKRLAE